MKAPIKLYISPTIYSTFQYRVPDPDDDQQVEYINKEFFLTKINEWLNENSLSIDIKDSSQECLINLTDFKQYLETLT